MLSGKSDEDPIQSHCERLKPPERDLCGFHQTWRGSRISTWILIFDMLIEWTEAFSSSETFNL